MKQLGPVALVSAVLVIAALAVTSCASEPAVREEIISRYQGGEKKVVAVYEGEGANETLKRRITFTEEGERMKVEDLETGKTRNYGDLHPEYSRPDSLESFLGRGVWVKISVIDGEEMYADDLGIMVADIYTADSLARIVRVGEIKRKVTSAIDYLDGFRVRGGPGGELDTTQVEIIRPDRIRSLNPDREEFEFERADVDEAQSLVIRYGTQELDSEQ